MASLTVTGIARLTRDAELTKSGSGGWINSTIAAYRRNVKEGKQSVDYFDVSLWVKDNKEGIEKTLKKGTLIYIDNGCLRMDEFPGPDNQPRKKFKIQIIGYEILAISNEPIKKEEKTSFEIPNDGIPF